MVVVATEACDCSTVCDDMHQKIVSMVVFVWNLCSSVSFLFSRGVGTVADEMSDVRTCPVSNKVSFEPVSEGLLVRAIFLNQNPKITRSRVQNPRWLICFFVDFPVSGVVRAKSQKVKLWCNVKLSEDMPPRTSQWNLLLEN